MTCGFVSFALMDQPSLITEFYTAFAAHDYQRMAACYHNDVEFSDPAFGTLRGAEVSAMWKMLIERADGKLKVVFSDVTSTSAHWEAFYVFGKTGRNVHNKIDAHFECKDGKIYRHRDYFNTWRWSMQALGISGLLLGYTSFFSKKLQTQTRKLLKDYMSKQ
jgi:ketosteroid isomerase-like protein